MQKICSTGLRVSEVRHITVDALRMGWREFNTKESVEKFFYPSSCAASFLSK